MPAGRHRPPRAHGLRGGEVLRAVPPAARLLARRRSTAASSRRCATWASRGCKNLQIGKPEKKVLSGGQRKRVNIALELVTDPVILFLDEPTSGLAADDTTALITLLADLTKKTGKTIVMTIHQPAKDEFEKFNLCFIMGYGGIPTYFGPRARRVSFFGIARASASGGRAGGIDNPRDMFDMLNVRERADARGDEARAIRNTARGNARLEAARRGAPSTSATAIPCSCRCTRAVGPSDRRRPPRGRAGDADVAVFRQFGLLCIAVLEGQDPRPGGRGDHVPAGANHRVMLALVFGGQKAAVPFWCLGALQELATRTT